MTAADAVRDGPRFGASIAGVPVLLPEGTLLEYIVDAAVFPLPRAPRRVIGLLQLRGVPVPVFDPSAAFERPAPRLRRDAVLVIGQGVDAGAVLVDEVPSQVEVAADDGEALPPDSPWRDALGTAVRDPSGRCWWRLSPRRLFEALSAEAVHP